MRGGSGWVVLLAGCGAAIPAPPPPPVAATEPTATSAPAGITSSPPAATGEPTPAASGDGEDVEFDNLAGTIDSDGPPAPCDFARTYRGTVGKAPCSVTLSRKGSKVRGSVAYDAGFGELELVGAVEADRKLTVTETAKGRAIATLSGVCDPATGAISGSWSGGGEMKALVLKPRDADGVPLVQRRRQFGKPLQDAPSCHWDVRRPAVFGLGDPGRTARINDHLRVRFVGASEVDMERRVKQCDPGTSQHVLGWYSIEANTQGLLSVLSNGYVYFGPAVHGAFNAAADAINIDIPTGRKLTLSQVVQSSRAFRPLVHSCMLFVADHLDPDGGGDGWWWERAIQGVPTDKDGEPVEESDPAFVPSSLYEPSFLVLPDGIAVLIRNQPTVSSAIELTGPVLRWGALLRAGVLNRRSPVRRLWANTKPLPSGEPTCVRFFEPRWAGRPSPR